MKYTKILEVKEDQERIYFSFLADNRTLNIIGVPKAKSPNQELYAGNSFQALHVIDKDKARFFLTEMMQRALSVHPAAQFCNKEALKLIE